MIIFEPTWDAVLTLVGLQHGRVLTDDEKQFLLWECTAWPMAGVVHIQRQLHEALTAPLIDRCHCCGTPKMMCVDDLGGRCCRDCYHPAKDWKERLG